MYGNQIPGNLNGLNPLAYKGNLPNMVIMDRRPTIHDYEGYFLGHFWLIPEVDQNDEAEVWILVGKFRDIATWKRIFDTSDSTGNQLMKFDVLDTPGSGTFTFDNRMLSVKVECVGGGGSSATLTGTYNNVIYVAGANAGGYTLGIFNRSQVGDSQDYTVGAGGIANMTPGNHNGQTGGTTTFGNPALLTATGGDGSSAVVIPNFGSVDGGIGSGGIVNQIGGSTIGYVNFITGGHPYAAIAANYGGSSFYGNNPRAVAVSGEDGYAVAGFQGSGASGVTVSNAAGFVGYGANGGDGLIVITQYLG